MLWWRYMVEWQQWGSPCEIISPGAVWCLTAGQRREAAGGDVITGAGDTGRAVGIYGQGFYKYTMHTIAQKQINKYIGNQHLWVILCTTIWVLNTCWVRGCIVYLCHNQHFKQYDLVRIHTYLRYGKNKH